MGTITRLRDSLYNVVTGLGTSKDPRTSFQYQYSPLDRLQLETAYRSDWIARKIVDAPADDATREWREWQAKGDQIQTLEDAEKELDLQRQLRRALIKARLYGGSAIVMGVANQGLSEEPLDQEKVGEGDLKFIAVFHQYELSPGPRIRDINSEWFNQPEYFTLATDVENINGDDNKMGSGVRIHPSRVIQLAGHELPDINLLGGSTNIWGDSVLQVVDNALKATGTVIDGIAGMVGDAKMDVINVPGLSGMMADDELSKQMVKRFTLANTMKSSINTLLLDEKETWQRIQTSFASMPQLIQQFLTVTAGASSIPVSRLLGQAKGKGIGGTEGGGEVDTRNYYDDISAMQRNELSPTLSPLDNVFIRSALGISDDSIYYEWTPLWQLSDTEKAAIALQKAQTAQADVTMGLINPDVLRTIRINQLTEDATYPGIEDAVEEEGAEPPEPTDEEVAQQLTMQGKSLPPHLGGPPALDKEGKKLPAPGKPPEGPAKKPSQFLDAWSEEARLAALEARRAKGKGKPDKKDKNSEFSGNKDTVTGWHGGTTAILDSVRKKGLTVGEDKSVWVAANQSTASLFAETKAEEGHIPIVFEVNVPREQWAKFRELKIARTASSTQKIPPEWITGYSVVDKKTGKLGKSKGLLEDAMIVDASTTKVTYVVLVPDIEEEEG